MLLDALASPSFFFSGKIFNIPLTVNIFPQSMVCCVILDIICMLAPPCSDINKIAVGIGDKLSISIQYLAAFVAGFIVAFTQEWRLTLFMLGLTPVLAAFGFLFGKITAAFTSREQKQYASAGAVAEEVLSSIRTVYAFGGEKQAAAK